MTNDKPSVSDIHTGPPASSREVEQPKKSQVVATRRRKPQAPLSGPSPEQRPAENRRFAPPPMLGAWPEEPTTEKVPLSEIRQRNFYRHTELVAVREAKERSLKESQKRAKREGKCPFLANTSHRAFDLEREQGVCGTFAVRRGLCRKHYNLKYLKVPPLQPGTGRTMRPFAGWQLPGNMTDEQHDCLRSLPLKTSYADALAAMNAADPRVKLEAIGEKPGLKKSKP